MSRHPVPARATVMKLTFLGTRAYIEARNRRHRRNASLLAEHRGRRVMIDCGVDWRGRLKNLNPDAIVITHGHPDHIAGLEDGAPCPVHATEATWEGAGDYPVEAREIVRPRSVTTIEGLGFEAFEVEHSTRCPAVGYRVTAGRTVIFYAPDLVHIHDREAALEDAALYVGDGSTLERSLVRKDGEHLIGHTPMRTQLTWCAKTAVPEAVFTHCGSEIVEGDERSIRARLNKWAKERDVTASIAHDGMTRVLR